MKTTDREEIKIVNNQYVIDTLTDLKSRDWALLPDGTTVFMTEKNMVDYLDSAGSNAHKILFTIGDTKRLKGILMIEMYDEVNDIALEEFPVDIIETSQGCFDDINEAERNIWKNGYKSARESLRYTDNDLIDFHNFVFRHQNQELFMGEYVKQFKLTLSKQIVGFEFEEESILSNKDGNKYNLFHGVKLKIHDTIYKKVTPINVIYRD